MPRLRSLFCALSAVSAGAVFAQTPSDPAPIAPPTGPTPMSAPSPIEPPLSDSAAGGAAMPQTLPAGVTPDMMSSGAATAEPTAARTNEFQGDDISLVLRSLARQARMNIVVSEKVVGTVTMRLEGKTPREAIEVIVAAKGLVLDQTNGVFFIKTPEERAKEPTESGGYTLSYATAEKVTPLLLSQLQSGVAPQFDQRTNTLFYRESRSNMDKIALFLETVDKPTQQVMIEARLVEVTANPRQSYGIDWNGVLNNKAISYGGSPFSQTTTSAGSNGPRAALAGQAPARVAPERAPAARPFRAHPRPTTSRAPSQRLAVISSCAAAAAIFSRPSPASSRSCLRRSSASLSA